MSREIVRRAALFTTWAAAACAASRPVAPTAPARRVVAGDTLTSPPRYEGGQGVFEVVSTVVSTRDGEPRNAPSTDTQVVRAIVRDDLRWTVTGLTVTGSIIWRSQGDIDDPNGEPPIPFAATIDTASGRVRFNHVGREAGCPTAHADALGIVRELLTAVPRSLTPGASWSDSLETDGCQDAMAVRTRAVRHFTVTLERGATPRKGLVVVVLHDTRATVASDTADTHGRPMVEGVRRTKARQDYDPRTGAYLDGAVETTIDLDVARSHVRQVLHTRVRPLSRRE
jgi:hypothetical protein